MTKETNPYLELLSVADQYPDKLSPYILLKFEEVGEENLNPNYFGATILVMATPKKIEMLKEHEAFWAESKDGILMFASPAHILELLAMPKVKELIQIY
jgi:hypothetical protein